MGPQSVIFGLIAAFAVQWTVTGGFSELASAFSVLFLPKSSRGSQPNFNSLVVGDIISATS